MRALRGPQPDAAAVVCFLQTAIRQAYQGSNPSVTLLSGRWSFQLSSNFVLTFAGQLSNDKIFRLRATLLHPFQPGASLIPQHGFTRVIFHSVLVVRTNGFLPSSDELTAELAQNEVCQGLRIVSPPKWIRSMVGVEKTHSSIILSFLDESGAALARILKNPPFLFSVPSVTKLFNSLPLACQCDRCHSLGHSAERCRFAKGTVICPICGGSHHASNHAQKCLTIKNHMGMFCNCPPHCINCHGARLPNVGHLAQDLSCPLHKNFRRPDNRTNDSSVDDGPRPMVIDRPIPSSRIPSSQPDKDEVVSVPRSPARTNAMGPSLFSNPTGKPIPAEIQSIFTNHTKWMEMDFDSLPVRDQ